MFGLGVTMGTDLDEEKSPAKKSKEPDFHVVTPILLTLVKM